MALEVIGSGLGRTGTKSLQSALDRLGFGPCYHMTEVFARPESMQLWIDASQGHGDWGAIFTGYRSAVDYPAAAYWRELAAAYPEAKVIHTVRDADAWFESTQATIFAPDGPAERAMKSGDGIAGVFFASFIGELAGHIHDRIFLTDYFRLHTERVKTAIAPERLLIYDVGEGWKPLCDFLGVPIPEDAFPAQNNRAEFIARVQASRGELPVGERNR